MRAAAPVVFCLLALTACGRQEAAPPPPVAAPSPAAPSAAPQPDVTATDFSRELNLLGNEPFWAVKIRRDGVTYSAPDQPELTGPNRGPQVNGSVGVWTTEAQGQAIKATLTAMVCQDGMSGLLYPFKAEVEVAGVRLEGCAAYADAMPREGGAS